MHRRRVLRMLGQAADLPASKTESEVKDVAPESTSQPETINNEATCKKESSSGPAQLEPIPELSASETDELDEQQAPKAESESESDLDEIEALERWDPMGEHYRSPLNTVTIDPDKEPESELTGKMAEKFTMIGDKKVCDHYLKHGSCADGKYCSRLHVSSSSQYRINVLEREYNMNTGKTRMVSSYLSPINLKPSDSTLILVSIAMIEKPTRFYFVAPYETMNFASFDRDDIDFYIGRVQQSSSLKTKLEKCHRQLAMLFDHDYRIDSVQQTIANGQMVACKLEDGRFCRATVRDTDRDDIVCLYELFLIDFGKVVKLPRESIYEIRASCLSEPPMAVLGRLELKPPGDSLNWPNESLAFFEDFIAKNKYLLCKVIAHREEEDLFTIDLLDIEERVSITSSMLSRNLAERMVL